METDLEYFSRRAAEELEAAACAESETARQQHLELAQVYRQVAEIYRDDPRRH
jgi:t-SNARE complex subunit (syntaxin)